MLHMPVVAYYSSAKPQSGYSGAVEGYAHKLALALGYDAIVMRPDALPQQPPEISIGLEQAQWRSARPLCEFKARPYADQHGYAPSMHRLSVEALRAVRAKAPLGQSRIGLVCIANPHWLAEQAGLRAAELNDWAVRCGVSALAITNSPRTNPLMWERFKEEMQRVATLPLSMNEAVGDGNDYVALLAAAQNICLLGSSRSMAAEAAMSGAPVTIVADDASAEALFFQHAADLMGEEAARYQPMPILHDASCYSPYDVTMHYVDQALAAIGAARAAA